MSRDASGRDWSDAQAPTWLSRGRLAKYASASASSTGATVPSTRTWTWLRSDFHRNSSAARGCSASWRPLWLSVLV